MGLGTVALAWLVAGLTVPTAEPGSDPKLDSAAIRVVAVHPDRQLSAVLDLFRGARVSSPPAALVAWKKATGRSLSKPVEAAITLFHPWNIQEFSHLDAADLAIQFDDSMAWWLRIPHDDDGAASALATAMELTDGGPDEPLNGHAVDRLGPPGSALMMSLGDGLTLAASNREMLSSAIEPSPAPDWAGLSSGFVARIRPSMVRLDDSLRVRQALEMVRGLGASNIDLATGLDDDRWFAQVRTRIEPPAEPVPVLDPDWLDDLPGEGMAAAGALAIDPRPASWNTLFRAIDLAIHADPDQAKVAPTRIRLSTLTIPVGVALESQVWPRIRGLAAATRLDASTGAVDGLLVILHATDPPSADRLARQVVPKLAKVAGGSKTGEPVDDPTITYLGRLRGRPLEVRLDGDRLTIGWGEGMVAASIASRKAPERSAGAVFKSLGVDLNIPCHHAAIAWPSRWPTGWASDELATMAVESLGPVTWVGRVHSAEATAVDEFRVVGLSSSVRAFLDRLPMPVDDQP